MRILSGGFLVLALLLAISFPAGAQSAAPAPPPATPNWPVTSSPARIKFHIDNPKGATLGWINLFLPDPQWASLPIRIFSDTGVPVASDPLWSAPGGPLTLLFTPVPGVTKYWAYPGSNWPALHLDSPRAGVLLESRAGDGKPVTNLAGMFQAWNQSTVINGRAMVPGIFEGGSRFGPETNILERFQGWFDVANPEHLELAVISQDASFVLVDGKEVVEWPGLHGFGGGMGGQHQGAIDLQPGVHLLEYYNAYVARPERRPILCCLAARGGALTGWTMLTPNVPFFRPVATGGVDNYEVQAESSTSSAGGSVPPFEMEWSMAGQTVVNPDVTNLGFISVNLTCHPAGGTMTWAFDDGSTAIGPNVTHLFLSPGMRVVQLSGGNGGKDLGSERLTVNVHPNWTMLTTHPPDFPPEFQKDMMARDPAALSLPDLASCAAVCGAFKNAAGLVKILPAVCANIKKFSDADMSYVAEASLFLATDWTHYPEAIQFLQAVADRCTQPNSPPQLLALGTRAQLTLGSLILTTSDHTDQVRSIIRAIAARTPPPAQGGWDLDSLRADLDLATGDITDARKILDLHTYPPVGPDARSSVHRTALLGQARVFTDRKDFESANQALQDVFLQARTNKLSPDWDLAQLRLYQAEDLPQAAYLWAKRLLPVITGNDRSELLFRLTELSFEQGDTELAHKSLSELLQKHPYSEQAAEAKQKWPGQD